MRQNSARKVVLCPDDKEWVDSEIHWELVTERIEKIRADAKRRGIRAYGFGLSRGDYVRWRRRVRPDIRAADIERSRKYREKLKADSERHERYKAIQRAGYYRRRAEGKRT